jgi:hypothetical protein
VGEEVDCLGELTAGQLPSSKLPSPSLAFGGLDSCRRRKSPRERTPHRPDIPTSL